MPPHTVNRSSRGRYLRVDGETHLAGIQRKLEARNRTEIAIWAWESRLLS
jgi:hypothetical protein